MCKSYLLLLCLACTIFSCRDSKKETTAETTGAEAALADNNWFAQSNIYEVNLRQYSGPGTINEFAKSLPRLQDMGVEILWFMPLTPIGITDRKEKPGDLGSYYAVRDYTAFNEDYGTMTDWKNFVQQAQGLGFKVIIDWVANHSAPDNHWMTEHPDFYVKDSAGKYIAPFDWTDVRKLNYDNPELRDSMIAAMKFWLNTGIDGFRCDVADEVPIDFWKRCISELRGQKPSVFMLAEGEKPQLHEAGFNASYAWAAMHAMENLYQKKYSLQQFDSVMNQQIETFPAGAARMFFTTNHDENSWNGTEFEKFGNASKAFAVFSQTMYQSIPLIYSGQEMANKKRLEFFVKDTIAWMGSYPMASFYRTMLLLRKSNPALAYNASYHKLSTSDSLRVFAYLREKDGHKVGVILNLSNSARPFTIEDAGITGKPLNVFMGVDETIEPGHQFSIEPWGYIIYNYQ